MSAVKVGRKINYIRGEGIIMNERRKTKRTGFSSHLVIKRLNGEGVDEVAIEIIDKLIDSSIILSISNCVKFLISIIVPPFFLFLIIFFHVLFSILSNSIYFLNN